jgi:hypothetical protein
VVHRGCTATSAAAIRQVLSDIAVLWMADRARVYGLEFVPGALSADGPPR